MPAAAKAARPYRPHGRLSLLVPLYIRRELPAVAPGPFLRMGSHGPRGFWASEGGWVAHLGVAVGEGSRAEVLVSGGEGRFDSVGAGLGRIWEQWSADDPCRFFGGCSFSPVHGAHTPSPTPDPAWAHFLPGRFHLPAVELVREPGAETCLLTVRGPDREALELQAVRWIEELRKGPDRSRSEPSEPCEASVTKADRSDWIRAVDEALEAVRTGRAEKVVLARKLEVVPAVRVDPSDVALALWEENPTSHAFLFEPKPGHALVCAAPEILADRVQSTVRATAVAGSIGTGTTSAETVELALQLLASDKDREEHAFVVNEMVQGLEGLGSTVRCDADPHVLALARIQHLETRIEADLPADVGLLEVVRALHPTPAVCGLPRTVAASILSECEGFDRGWYAGPVGWIDRHGEGTFVPALRSAVYSDGRWHLFAGAGIVADSDPESEWKETGLKFEPVLRALIRAGISADVLGEAA